MPSEFNTDIQTSWPAPYTVDSSRPAVATVIWLHGLGDNGRSFVPLVRRLCLPETLPVRFVFPNAPERPVTLNNGVVMPAWYDIYALDGSLGEDASGIAAAGRQLSKLVQHEISKGIPAHSIVLAGFSQGGAVALQCGLRFPKRLGGLLVASSYLPIQHTLEAEANLANRDTPILMLHGLDDTVVSMALALNSLRALKTLQYNVTWKTFSMAHEICSQEVSIMSDWLFSVLCKAKS